MRTLEEIFGSIEMIFQQINCFVKNSNREAVRAILELLFFCILSQVSTICGRQ